MDRKIKYLNLFFSEQAAEDVPTDEEENMDTGGDPAGGDFGGDTSFDDNNQEMDSETIGRVYELKKIYNKLLEINNFLADETDEFLMKLREYNSRALELFKILISNIDKFKDKLDDIIVQYYVFIQKVFMVIKKVYILRQKENGDR